MRAGSRTTLAARTRGAAFAALAAAALPACGHDARAAGGTGLVRLVDVVESSRIEPSSAAAREEPEDELPRAGVARVELDGMHREAVLLDAPGELTWRIALPDRAPRLRLFVGPTGAAETGEPVAVLAVAVRAAGEDPLAAELEVRDLAVWRELSLDLAPLAGREVELALGARLAGAAVDRVAVPLALGNPTVEGRPAAGAPERPDVVLVSLDTVRRDRLSLYGAELPTSPVLDALAAESAVFDTAVAPSSWTLPSHVSLFTGQLPVRHRVDRRGRRFDLQREADGLAASFRAAGYETLAYTAGGYVHPEFGLAVGFERYGTRELVLVDRSDGVSRRLATSPEREELLAALAGERRRPVFAFVHTYGAHGYRAAEEDLRALGLEATEVDAMADFLAAEVSPEAAAAWDGDPEPLRLVYDASIRGVDALVGDLVAALERGGRLDASYLVVLSDHGEELAEHGVFGHSAKLVEELVRVPLLLRGPGIRPGRVGEAVSLCDVAPTLRELVGLPARPDRDGRSLAPFLRGEDARRTAVLSSVFLGEGRRLAALRDEQLKLLAVLEGDRVVHAELFDVLADPGENRDLADERPADLERMVAALRARLAAIEPDVDAEAYRESEERVSELADLGYVED